MNTYTTNDIAIIGLSTRFPKAPDHFAFWDMLVNKRSGVTHLSDKEMDKLDIPESKRRKAGFVNAGAIVDDPYHWDASFFGYSPKTAAILDPQQRLLLESAWEMIETAGYSPFNISRPTGVFISVASNNYSDKFREGASQSDDYIAFTSNDADFASSRISYHLNLKGPSVTVETACSSSLVSVHMACESLLNNEVDMAICGGSSLLFPQAGYIYDPNLIFSPDGLCRPFDRDAKGTVFGNGIGLILLKRLDDALKNKDTIWGIIKGSAVNNDGRSKNSYYSPSPEGQKKVIQEALAVANISAESISYVEAHGTATPIGDPIEFEALMDVFTTSASSNSFRYLGSVKSNLGHLNKAAGIAGLIKTVLALKNKMIPATLHYNTNNPEIDIENSPFRINADTVEWKKSSFPRRAGVSSFGVGGTNAHIILEEAPPIQKRTDNTSGNYYIFPVSAKSEEYLELYKKKLADFLKEHPNLSIEDISYTLQRRATYPRREGVVCHTVDAFTKWLETGEQPTRDQSHSNKTLERWQSGEHVQWPDTDRGTRIWLPPHPMIKAPYHISDYTPQKEVKQARLLPLIQENHSVFNNQLFKTTFKREEYLLQEHNFILPAAAYIEMIAECLELSGASIWNLELKDILWKQAFTIKEAEENSLFISLRNTDNAIEFFFSTDKANPRQSLSQGSLAYTGQHGSDFTARHHDLTSLLTSPFITGHEVYAAFNHSGFRYGEHFQLIRKIYRSGDKALANIDLTRRYHDKDTYILDPLLIDAAFQTAVSLLPSFDSSLELFVPYQVRSARFYKKPVNYANILAIRLSEEPSSVERFHVYVLDQDQSVCMEFLHFELVRWNKSGKTTPKTITIRENTNTHQLLDRVTTLLCKVLSEELGHRPEALNIEENFESLGLDSVILVNVINRLDKHFDGLPKTLFFEYPTIIDAGQYLIENYPDHCSTIAGDKQPSPQESAARAIPSSIFSSNHQPPLIKAMQAYDKHSSGRPKETDIAIIGVHGRYPESEDLNAFWKNLKQGADCIREIPKDRWQIEGFYDSDVNKTTTSFSKWGGFLNKIEYFDPIFFKIAPKEAAFIDPQERLFLESAWSCIENAGYTPKNVCDKERKVGVYAGVMWGHYQLYAMEEYQKGEILVNNSSYWSIPNRVSYTMNFNGPSMAIDTACSSSLTAIHLACQSIVTGECDLAVAGGVNLNIHPYKHYILSARRFAATDGRCRSFGEGGSGYVPGEGVGTVLLKPLNKAIEDGDFIYAVLKGSAVNHGGKVSGYTVPNSNAQATVVKRAFDQAGVSPADISYIEAHGTGTSLGDPIEINGLIRAYADQSGNRQYCPIGSVKSNIGHLESAAGIASIHKVILQLNHRTLVPSIHNEPVNPYIDFQNSPFRIQKSLEEWKNETSYHKRLAGISSFGAGGANAHIVVEEAPARTQSNAIIEDNTEKLIILSAQDESTLLEYARDLLNYLKNPGYIPLSLTSLAYTLQTGRVAFDHRLAFAARDLHEVKNKLRSCLEGNRDQVFLGKVNKSAPLSRTAEQTGKRNMAELAKAWVDGVPVDWHLLWEYTPGRTPLPSYPFNRRRLWYKDIGPGEPMAKILGSPGQTYTQSPSPAGTSSDTDGFVPQRDLHLSTKPEHEAMPVHYFTHDTLPAPLTTTNRATGGTLVLFSQVEDEYAHFNSLYYNNVIRVRHGHLFQRDHSGYQIPFSSPDSYQRLYGELSVIITQPEFDILINIGSIFNADEDLLVNFFRHAKQLTESFKKQKINFVAYWHSQNRNEAAYRALGSFAKVIAKELSRLNIKVVEFRQSPSLTDYTSKLIHELNNRSSKKEALYIDQQRYEYAITRISSIPEGQIPVKEDGVYLITGGMGAIGLTMASWLTTKGVKKVLLTGRKNLSELNDSHREFLKRNQERIAYLPADITDLISTQNLVSSIISEYGGINGIFHSAGIINDKLLIKKTEENFQSVVSPKIKGALNLDTACSAIVPDFVIYFSSVSAVAGQMGQVDYSTANRFLDEYAAYRNTISPTVYKSVNWPYWNNGGMILAQPYVDMMRKNGMDGITNDEGAKAMDHILRLPYNQVIVFKGNKKGCEGFFTDTHLDMTPRQEPANKLQPDGQPLDNATKDQYLRQARQTETTIDIRKTVHSILSEALGFPPSEIDTTVNLEEYGADSVVIMKVTAELEKLFPELSISLFFECKSIDDLAAKISEELRAGSLTYLGDSGADKTLTTNNSTERVYQTQKEIPNTSDLKTEIRNLITGILSDVLGLAQEEMNTSADLEEYGVDSVAIMKVTSELEKRFPDLSISLFFECKSIDHIVDKISGEVATGGLTYIGAPTTSRDIPGPASPIREHATGIQNGTKDKITVILSEVLGLSVNEIDTAINLEEYGVDSVAIMRVTTELEKLYSGLSISLFFECKSIDDLAGKIEEELKSGLLTANITYLNDQYNAETTISTDHDPGAEIQYKITEILQEALGLQANEIDTSVNLEEYGADSVVIMKVTAELEKLFPELSISIFFECKSIDDIVIRIRKELEAGTLTYSGKKESYDIGARNPATPTRSPKEHAYYRIGETRTDHDTTSVSLLLDTRSIEVSDHVIDGKIIFAGAGYLDLVKNISEKTQATPVNTFRNISWFAPLLIQDDEVAAEARFTLKGDARQYSFTSSGKPLAKGEISYTPLQDKRSAAPFASLPSARTVISGDEVYEWFASNNFQYGNAFQTIETLYVSQDSVTGKLRKPSHSASWISPMILDGAFQCVAGFTVLLPRKSEELWVPFFAAEITIFSEATPDEIWVTADRVKLNKTTDIQQFNIAITDSTGNVLMEIKNFTLKSFRVNKTNDKAEKTKSVSVTAEKTEYSTDPIAIISVSCKFPGADSPEEFWRNIRDEVDVVREIPADRWDYRPSFHPVKGTVGKTYSKWGGFVNHVDAFDNEFFRIKENDALCLDPQQRILLELAQHLFDRAGYTRPEISNKNIAVIIGAGPGVWNDIIADLPFDYKRNVVVNTIQNMIAARISDFFDLKGASLTLDTACSSSLVAVHEACQKIRSGECDMAIAGGITLLLHGSGHVGFSQAQVLSPNGKCHVFDKNADGIVLGEGAGLVLLKSYKQAVRDGDRIHAVIRGSAVNNDGKTMGITTPNMAMQKEVIKAAIKNSGIDRHSVTYLEAHGTGTLLGDPIEVKAAKEVYGENSNAKQYCAISSVKSNIGHLLHASGIASLIKVAMALENKTLPASLNCKEPHPRFEFQNSIFYPVTSSQKWEGDHKTKRAAISSFGFGGTNCHLIAEEVDPIYVPARTSLPLTIFHRKRFWPGKPIEHIANGATSPILNPGPSQPTPNTTGLSDIIEKLVNGSISIEQALELEKSL